MTSWRHELLCLSLIVGSVVVMVGCSSPTYINDVDPLKTRRISPDSVGRRPERLTIAELYRVWGGGGAGKELIYLYRSTNDGEWLYVMAALSARLEGGCDSVGNSEVIKILLVREGNEPVIIWESEVKNDQIDRVLERELNRHE